jgi:hypothetical protein
MNLANDSTFLRLIANQERNQLLPFLLRKIIEKKAKKMFDLERYLKFSKEKLCMLGL